ncbi:N-(5'-phosphoribosyl)anthranilate isomerase [Paenibacillus konkukensis]|uniref:N-(5'-phosphoribosyl)anthranilate isomerase n=1 Tax=Paenibacillus konkukensis TaxID=2020716 RepID=A0ABY4RHR0_9BACL|nr:phosphoribosylanthranilate isomerase [Paenibacillus konkukensis]UQZ81912.1 N-(5'-phosphoribosyl)anthranilate isomerase [Paenibacillus konkukensis]
MTSVKICGLKTPDMVQSILHLPIDYIGFVFAKSKRQVTPQQAGEMIRVIAERREAGKAVPLTVGVLVNPTREELVAVMQEAPLDILQLHGHETPQECRRIKSEFPGVKLWRVVSVARTGQAAGANDSDAEHSVIAAALDPYAETVDAILLDTFDPVYGGGSGKTFSWEAIPPYQAWSRAAGIPLLVAGGLQPDNVGELLDVYTPDGVDVSSGVETDGVKDIMKITSFVERVKHRV